MLVTTFLLSLLFLNSQNVVESMPESQPNNSFLHESQLLFEYEELKAKKRLFFEEKENFDKERLLFTNAAIRLAEEVCCGFISHLFLILSYFPFPCCMLNVFCSIFISHLFSACKISLTRLKDLQNLIL